MMIRNVLLCCAALAFAPACGKSGPADKLMSIEEDLAKAADASGGDCTKAADGFDKVLKGVDLKALMKDLQDSVKGDEKQAEELDKKFKDRSKAAEAKIKPVAEKCKDDPKFKAFNDKLEDLL